MTIYPLSKLRLLRNHQADLAKINYKEALFIYQKEKECLINLKSELNICKQKRINIENDFLLNNISSINNSNKVQNYYQILKKINKLEIDLKEKILNQQIKLDKSKNVLESQDAIKNIKDQELKTLDKHFSRWLKAEQKIIENKLDNLNDDINISNYIFKKRA